MGLEGHPLYNMLQTLKTLVTTLDDNQQWNLK